MKRIAALIVWVLLAPSAGWACPGCVADAWGDRTFGWSYLSLYLAPFFVASVIAGVLAYHFRARRPLGSRARAFFSGIPRRWRAGFGTASAPAPPAPRASDVRGERMTGVDKETT